ncbi:MAG: methyltransferase domain-containing protein, partial [Candidatus Omnitrophica bacterium]|nr:methyltransferase domain-containing protein [Candidatus Omnitrophota bacterium]
DRGAVIVTLTGGEPLLREDVEEIVGAFDQRSCLILGTTGAGLTLERAVNLRAKGLFAVGVSLDSTVEKEHDRLRGKSGAFRAALAALETARQNGLYPYVVSVATREFLERRRFMRFLRFAGAAGALEVHLLEPSATGRLTGRTDVLLTPKERRQLADYQREIAHREDLPIVSALAHLESAQAFGCGAGLTHLYIDGSGEVCPCNLVPLSFGNITREPLDRVMERMGRHFQQPRTHCVGRLLAKHVRGGSLPTLPDVSSEICGRYLPSKHALPRFFRARQEASPEVGKTELREAYDRVHADYDEHWLKEAAGPVEDLVRSIDWQGVKTAFEAGCGTGYATALIAPKAGRVMAMDLSPAMLVEARERLESLRAGNVEWLHGDALAKLEELRGLDLVFSSWVLGYIPLKPFFAAASDALMNGGQLAFVVHRENSPREPMEVFAELIGENPKALRKRVAFDFPRDTNDVRSRVEAAGFKIERLWDGQVIFRVDSAESVLEHLLKSGAGTAFYEAIDPRRRNSLSRRFLGKLAERHPGKNARYDVVHDYVACVARRGVKVVGISD